MNKILLVYEDYADLMTVEAALKKVGFDVIGLTNEYSIAEQIVGFNPDLVVGSGRSGRVSSLGVGKRLKEMVRWQGKSVLIFPTNFKPNPQELIRIRVDMILESPVLPSRLVQVIGKMLGHDEGVLITRLNKTSQGESVQKLSEANLKNSAKFSAEEAILVKGVIPDEDAAGDSARKADRVENSVLKGPNVQERNEEIFFKSAESAPSELAEAFSDVDLKALEQEIVSGTSEIKKPKVFDDEISTAAVDNVEPLDNFRDGALPSEEDLKNRIAKYSKMVADVKISSPNSISRVEAKRRQKEISKNFDNENNKDIDELRKQFTKALFKK
ncbi:MAG: hypothetical protein ACXVCY_12780 [Pseudobdellovibrionaceae bacterium]